MVQLVEEVLGFTAEGYGLMHPGYLCPTVVNLSDFTLAGIGDYEGS